MARGTEQDLRVSPYAENAIYLSKCRLQGRSRQKVSTAIPHDVPNAVKIICYAWNGGGDDGLVEGNEEDCETKGNDDGEECGAMRVGRLVFGFWRRSFELILRQGIDGGRFLG